MSALKVSRPPARAALVKLVAAALDDMKAANVKVLDVRQVTDVADCMVLASGTSDRHVRSIADRVVERAKEGGFRPLGVEGQRDGEWVLVDLNDVIVHVMLPRVREFYALETLWETAPLVRASRSGGKAAPRAKAKAKARAKTGAKSARAKTGAKSAARSGGASPRSAKKSAAAPRRAAKPGSAARSASKAASGRSRPRAKS
jgi:ribosome-associated protein